MPTAAIPYLMLVSAAVAAGTASKAHDDANQANQDTLKGQQQIKDQQSKADADLQDQQNKNTAKQTQDAQWMSLKAQANKMAGMSTQAPAALAGQSGSTAGALAGNVAGKSLLGA